MAIEAINNVSKNFQTRSILDNFVGFGARAVENSRYVAQVSPAQLYKESLVNRQNRLNDPVNSTRGILQNRQG